MTHDPDQSTSHGDPLGSTHTLWSAATSPGSDIGPYRLVRQIGEGGMGLVFHAQQMQPIRRDVALKLIKPGMDSRNVVARFESERQALALMDHPNIARVYDAGSTVSGLPYFAMEFVPGVPITRYCDSKRLTLRQRLELFIPVCRAIQHAHQKGIIHRDIKPSNVLVMEREGAPVPKVIDFGLAKALGEQMTDATMMTAPGSVVGTLHYMSPEQAELGKQDIDTRSDIYSLGVVLYELITGTTPIEEGSLERDGYLSFLERIREEEPVPPSYRSRRSAKSAEIAQRRGSDPARYANLVHGELDWIVMKALEKERARRYETANGMARDLERFLSGEPLEAAPASTWYRVGKVVRKHRAWIATGTAFLALLLGAVVVSSWMAIRATQAEREALREQNAAKSVIDFLQNDLLAQASAMGQAGQGSRPDPDLKVRTALDRAAARIEGKFRDQPLIEASVRHTLGITYERLGLYPEASKHIDRALEIRRRELGDEHADTAKSLRLLGTLRWDQGKYAEAEAIVTKALAVQKRLLGESHPDVLSSMNTLAASVAYQGKYAQAADLFEVALAAHRRVLGEESSQTLYLMNNLAATHFRQGKFSEAEALHAKALEIRTRVQGEQHPGTLNSLSNLGEVYLAEGRYAEARTLHAQALETRRRVLGEEHPDTLTSLRNLAMGYMAEGKYLDALPMFERVLEARRRVLGPEHPKTLVSAKELAMLHHAAGRDSQAEAPLVRSLEIQRRVMGAAHPDTLETMLALGSVRLQLQDFNGAEAVMRDAVASYLKSGSVGWQRFVAETRLGMALAGAKKFDQAEPHLLTGYEGWARLQATIPAPDRPSREQIVSTLVQFYETRGQLERAVEWKKKLR